MIENNCPSCQSPFLGKFCNNCGEKKIESSDFTITHIIGEGFSFFTNLDSKLYQTITGLLFKPGFLTKAYIDGRRTKYMKPFQIFILSSILFFIFLSHIDIFLVPAKWFFEEHNADIVSQLMEEKNVSRDMIAQIYDAKVANNSKIYVFILIPFLALLLYLFSRKQMPEFGKQLIHSVHIISFFMVVAVLYTKLLNLFPFVDNKWWFIISIQLSFSIYLAFSIKNVHGEKIQVALLQSLLITLVFGFLIGAYRYGISYYTLLNL